MNQVVESIQAARTQNPKTILAFFAIVLSIVVAGAISLTAVLAWSGQLVWLIPWVIGVCAVVAVGIFVVTVVIMWKDPSKLMLTGISGKEYVAIQRKVILGDSSTGEHLAPASELTTLDALPLSPQPLEPATADSEDSDER